MLRRRQIKTRKRGVHLTLERLEDRLELAVVAAASQYMAALDRLDGQLVSRVDQIHAHIVERTAQLDVGYQSAIGGAAASGGGAVAPIDGDFHSLVRNTRRSVNVLERRIDGRLDQIARRYDRLDPVVQAVNPAVVADIRQAAAADGSMLDNEALTAVDLALSSRHAARPAADPVNDNSVVSLYDNLLGGPRTLLASQQPSSTTSPAAASAALVPITFTDGAGVTHIVDLSLATGATFIGSLPVILGTGSAATTRTYPIAIGTGVNGIRATVPVTFGTGSTVFTGTLPVTIETGTEGLVGGTGVTGSIPITVGTTPLNLGTADLSPSGIAGLTGTSPVTLGPAGLGGTIPLTLATTGTSLSGIVGLAGTTPITLGSGTAIVTGTTGVRAPVAGMIYRPPAVLPTTTNRTGGRGAATGTATGPSTGTGASTSSGTGAAGTTPVVDMGTTLNGGTSGVATATNPLATVIGYGTTGAGTVDVTSSGLGTISYGTTTAGSSGQGTTGFGASGVGTTNLGTSGLGTTGFGASGVPASDFGGSILGTTGPGVSDLGTIGTGMIG